MTTGSAIIVNDLSLDQLQRDVHTALKQWHRANYGDPLGYLTLIRSRSDEGRSTRLATKQLLLTALDELADQDRQGAFFLQQRFVDDLTLLAIANRFNRAESGLYPLQKRAIRSLAQVIFKKELEARASQESLLDMRLGSPTYTTFVGRQGALEQLETILSSSASPAIVAIVGIGGIGKTAAADAVVRRLVSKGVFGRIVWITAGPSFYSSRDSAYNNDSLVVSRGIIQDLLAQVVDYELEASALSDEEAVMLIRERLREEPYLIVIDNLERLVYVEGVLTILRRLTTPAKLLITTRVRPYSEPDVFHVVLGELSAQESLQLLRLEGRRLGLVEPTEEELSRIYAIVGGNPLALKLAMAQLAMLPLEAVLDSFEAPGMERNGSLFDYIYGFAWATLSTNAQEVLLGMTLLPIQGATFDELSAITTINADELQSALQELVTLNLVYPGGELSKRRYGVHELTRRYIVGRLT